MANVIKHKRGSGSDPVASDLVVGEVAIRTDVGKLFTKMDNGSVAEIAGGGSDIAINTLSSSSGTGGGSATFNGSAYRFTLSAPPSVSAAQLLVSINGVIQKPVTGTGQPSEGFAVDGTDIILGDAPATGSDFFILTFKSLGVSEPADNSVTSAKIVDGTIVNADINASAAIAGTKISPDFGSQNITTTGSLTGNGLVINSTFPSIQLNDTNHNSDFSLINGNGFFRIFDDTASASRFSIASDGTATFGKNLDCLEGVDVTGAITGTGDLTIDTNTLHVDSSNNRVGIGTTSPTGQLHISSGTSGDCRVYIEADTDNNNEGDNPFIIFRNDGGFENAAVWAGNADGANDNSLNLSAGTDSGGGIRFFTSGINNGWETAPERMRINSSGNVGIGTTSPGHKLHLKGTDTAYSNSVAVGPVVELEDAAGRKSQLIAPGAVGEAGVGTPTSHDFTLFTANTERIRIKNTGNVGIGTASPNYELQVNDPSGTISVLQLTNTTTGTAAGDGLLMYITGNDTIISNEEAGYMRFQTSGIERMRIDTAGNVGIGATSITANTNYNTLQIQGQSGSGGAILRLQTTDGSTSKAMIFADTGGLSLRQETNHPIILSTNNAERMRIDSSGNVGINEISPVNLLTISTSGAQSDTVGMLQVRYTGNGNANSGLTVKNYYGTSQLMQWETYGVRIGNRIITNSGEGNVFITAGNDSVRKQINADGQTNHYYTTAANPKEIYHWSNNRTGMSFRSANVERGNIFFFDSGVQFNTGSDYRLKENVTTISDGITRIKQLIPRKFNWIIDESNTPVDGFLAHEVSSIVPEAINGTKDAVATQEDVDSGRSQKVGDPIHQMIDHSKLVPLLTAALQEAIGRIEVLEAK